MKINKKIFLVGGLVLLSGVVLAASYSTGYRANKGTSVYIEDMGDKGVKGGGYTLENNSQIDYFIPTKSQQEWDSFKKNKPESVRVFEEYSEEKSSSSCGLWKVRWEKWSGGKYVRDLNHIELYPAAAYGGGKINLYPNNIRTWSGPTTYNGFTFTRNKLAQKVPGAEGWTSKCTWNETGIIEY